MSDKARKAWESTRLAHQTNPATNSMPKTWEEFERWLLHRFDELNAEDRLWDDFLNIRQTSDVQSYCAEFMLAYQLTKAKLDDESLHRHFIKNLKPSLQQEWKRLQTKPTTWEDIGRELVRLEDVTASGKPAARAPLATAAAGQDSDAMDLDVLNATRTQSADPPSRGSPGCVRAGPGLTTIEGDDGLRRRSPDGRDSIGVIYND
ncbi:hypothetical protein KEM52_004901, partial [Ascosphaera acerosa]